MSEYNNEQFYTGDKAPENPGFLANVPNATLILVLGIVSIVLSCCNALGIIPGIIAIIMAGKAKRIYESNPLAYTPSSIKNVKAGRITGIVGTVIGLLVILAVIALASKFGWDAIFDSKELTERIKEWQEAQGA